MDDELLRMLLTNPVVYFVVTLFVLASFLSKRVAEIGGPLGTLARWWSGRQLRRLEAEQELTALRREGESQEMQSLRAEVTRLSADVALLHRDQAKRGRRVEALERWAHLAIVTAARAGVTLPDLPTEDPQEA